MSEAELAARTAPTPDLSGNQHGTGRDIFALFRANAALAEEGIEAVRVERIARRIACRATACCRKVQCNRTARCRIISSIVADAASHRVGPGAGSPALVPADMKALSK